MQQISVSSFADDQDVVNQLCQELTNQRQHKGTNQHLSVQSKGSCSGPHEGLPGESSVGARIDTNTPDYTTPCISIQDFLIPTTRPPQGKMWTVISRQLLSAPICSPLQAPGCVPGVSYCSVTGSPLWVYVLQMIPVSRLLPKHRTDEEDSSKMCWMSKLQTADLPVIIIQIQTDSQPSKGDTFLHCHSCCFGILDVHLPTKVNVSIIRIIFASFFLFIPENE